ncbi:AbrB/MazE/SpoVT family DNA-binding domain-containing protein, partial [Candidatus Uhrbacteria bacterium]|nr:AbrB/MazE/SpoVT family DNA-binding domain-containing protein [Candidatus Uhrbacteria bacterium]
TEQGELVRLRRFSQITLPTEVRNHFNLSEGDYLEAEVVKHGILLKPVSVINKDRAWRDVFFSMNGVRSHASLRSKNIRAQENAIAKLIKASRKKTKK